MSDADSPGPWLSIVGIGEDGADGLVPRARRLVEDAEIVFGGQRHLALAGPLVTGEARPWPSPFDAGEVLAHRGRRVCVLASGDPFHYGVGPLLTRALPTEEFVAVPAPSAFSLAAARLGWPLAETAQISLHGRPIEQILPHLQPGAGLLVLTADGDAPAAIAALITEAGYGPSSVAVLEAMGGPRERVRLTRAEDFDLADVDPLNTLAIAVVPADGAQPLPLVPGLPDDAYEHDGQLTKQAVRAATLAALAPRRGALLWDVGAGSGAIAIEWMRAGPSLRAVAIEIEAERAERIARNAARFGLTDLLILRGPAPAALEGLDPPDAIFLGCGASDSAIVDHALAALRPGGRLVVNAVTLASEAAILACHAVLGGELTRIGIARAAPLGGQQGWRPALPVTQWTWVKP